MVANLFCVHATLGAEVARFIRIAYCARVYMAHVTRQLLMRARNVGRSTSRLAHRY